MEDEIPARYLRVGNKVITENSEYKINAIKRGVALIYVRDTQKVWHAYPNDDIVRVWYD